MATSSRVEEKRRLAAERVRRHRERRRQQEDPEGYAAEQATKALTAQAEADRKAQDEATRAALAAQEAADLKALEVQLTDAIAGTAHVLSEGIRHAWMHPKAPPLGDERARRIAELWSPIIAPYVQKSGLPHLPLIIAGAGTAGIAAEWLGEARRAGAADKPARHPALAAVPSSPEDKVS